MGFMYLNIVFDYYLKKDKGFIKNLWLLKFKKKAKQISLKWMTYLSRAAEMEKEIENKKIKESSKVGSLALSIVDVGKSPNGTLLVSNSVASQLWLTKEMCPEIKCFPLLNAYRAKENQCLLWYGLFTEIGSTPVKCTTGHLWP